MDLSISQGEEECRALIRRCIRPHTPAMPVQYPADRRETDTGAGKLSFGMKALEGRKKPVGVLRVETGAIVSHEVD